MEENLQQLSTKSYISKQKHGTEKGFTIHKPKYIVFYSWILKLFHKSQILYDNCIITTIISTSSKPAVTNTTLREHNKNTGIQQSNETRNTLLSQILRYKFSKQIPNETKGRQIIPITLTINYHNQFKCERTKDINRTTHSYSQAIMQFEKFKHICFSISL